MRFKVSVATEVWHESSCDFCWWQNPRSHLGYCAVIPVHTIEGNVKLHWKTGDKRRKFFPSKFTNSWNLNCRRRIYGVNVWSGTSTKLGGKHGFLDHLPRPVFTFSIPSGCSGEQEQGVQGDLGASLGHCALGGRPFTGRKRRCLENTGCPVRQISFSGKKVSLVTALFLVQASLSNVNLDRWAFPEPAGFWWPLVQIILIPKWHILGWQILFPFRSYILGVPPPSVEQTSLSGIEKWE